MKENAYISIVPTIKIWETKLLNKSYYDKIINSVSLDEAIASLGDTVYGENLKNDNYEKALDESFAKTCRELNGVCADTGLIEFVCLKNDYHNVKTLIKSKILDRDFSYMLSNNGTVAIEKIEKAVFDCKYDDIPSEIKEAIIQALESYESNSDSQEIDIVVDRKMFERMSKVVNGLDNVFMKKYFTKLVDFTNIKTVLRLKKMGKDKTFLNKVFISGGIIDLDRCGYMLTDSYDTLANRLARTDYELFIKEAVTDYMETKSLTKLEKKIDDTLMNFVRDAKFVSFGIEPVYAYLYAREAEIKNLRVILAGKANNVDLNIINERLRDNYV